MKKVIGKIRLKNIIRYSIYHFGKIGDLCNKELDVIGMNDFEYVCINGNNMLIDIDRRDVLEFREQK